MSYCSASVRAVSAWNSSAALLFSICQGCSCLESVCCLLFTVCSICQDCSCLGFVCCSTVQPLSGLFLLGIRLLHYCSRKVFSYCQSGSCLDFVCLHSHSASFRAVSCLKFVCRPTVQTLFVLFLPRSCLLAMLFSLCLGCSCLEFDCFTTIQPLSGLFSA